MGRVIAQQWMSVDGLVAGPDGEEDVFNAVEAFAPSEAHNLALLESVDEILLGRQTYAEWVQFSPTAGNEPMADRVNQLAKVVCSTSLDAAPWGEHAPATVVRDGSHTPLNVGVRGGTRSSGAASDWCVRSWLPGYSTRSSFWWPRLLSGRARRCLVPTSRLFS